MSSKELHKDLPLPLPNGTSVVQPHSKGRLSRLVMALITFSAFMGTLFLSFNRYPITASPAQVEVKSSYSTLLKHNDTDLCPGGVSYTGHIALKNPGRLSFYWFFQAQTEDWKTAPTILTFGGGPGVTGLSYPLRGESHCRVSSTHTTVRNSWAWTKQFNLLALDHPIGVGFSTGAVVGGSAETARDVYDFLQRFFTLEEFKDLAKNRFIISSGSYGGIYVPHVATVIQSANRAIAQGHQSGIKIDLDSVMLNGPVFDGKNFYSDIIKPRCEREDILTPEECNTLRLKRPECVRRIRDSLESGRSQDRKAAEVWCENNMDPGNEQRCLYKITLRPDTCNPQREWIEKFIANKKSVLGLGSQDFQYHGYKVWAAFREIGDGIQNTQPLYESLLQDGVRILTYVGKLDYACHSWGIRHFLSLLNSGIARAPYRHSRHVGTGGWTIGHAGEKGEITLIEVDSAGHLSISDQPDIIQEIVEHWINKKEFLKYRHPRL